MSASQLTAAIIARSHAKTWDQTKLEWVLHDVYEADEPETCLCGHFPIIELCSLRNKVNGNYVTVGNCCVKKFIGLPSEKIFQAVKRVRKDRTKSLNAEAVGHAYMKVWITEWERDFYFGVMRKRNLTQKQVDKKIQINEKFVQKMQRPS
jgi:hypothetical protein